MTQPNGGTVERDNDTLDRIWSPSQQHPASRSRGTLLRRDAHSTVTRRRLSGVGDPPGVVFFVSAMQVECGGGSHQENAVNHPGFLAAGGEEVPGSIALNYRARLSACRIYATKNILHCVDHCRSELTFRGQSDHGDVRGVGRLRPTMNRS